MLPLFVDHSFVLAIVIQHLAVVVFVLVVAVVVVPLLYVPDVARYNDHSRASMEVRFARNLFPAEETEVVIYQCVAWTQHMETHLESFVRCGSFRAGCSVPVPTGGVQASNAARISGVGHPVAAHSCGAPVEMLLRVGARD